MENESHPIRKMLAALKNNRLKYGALCASAVLAAAAVIIVLSSFLQSKQDDDRAFPATPDITFAQAGLRCDTELDAFELMDFEEQIQEYYDNSIAVFYHGERILHLVCGAQTVGELLAVNGILLDENDILNLPLEETLAYNMNIIIDHIVYEQITVEESIPYGTDVIPSETIPKGTRRLVREGKEGKKAIVYNCMYKNGEEQTRVMVDSVVTEEPVNEQYEEGGGGVFTAPDGREYRYSYYLDVKATAYGHTAGTHTYTGKRVSLGMIAVDPRYIPLGSKVYVIGNYGDYGVCMAEDTGGMIKGARIDVYLHDEEVVTQFGVRNMRVYILEE